MRRYPAVVRAGPQLRVVDEVVAVGRGCLCRHREVARHYGYGVPGLLEPEGSAKPDDAGP